jgi:hypothetical protein
MSVQFASALNPFGRKAYEQALGIPSESMLEALPYADWSEAQQLNALAAQTTPSWADAVQETGLTARERKIESYTNLLARAQSAEQISQLIMWDDNFFAQAVGDVRRNGFDSEFAALSGFEMGREDDPNRLADALASQREQFAAAILDRADFAGAIATRGLNGIGVDGFEGMSHPEVAKLSSDTIDFFGDPASFEDVTREQFQAMYASGLMDYKTHDVVGFPAEQRRLDKASLIAGVVTLGTSIALNPRAAINTVNGIGRAGLSALQFSGKQLGRLKDVFAGNFAALARRVPQSNTGIPIPRVNVADKFVSNRYKDGSIDLDYLNPDAGHGLLVSVDSKGVLGFEVRAQGDSARLGSGTDMFASAMLRLEKEGVEVKGIRGAWELGTDSVNTAEYLLNLKNNMTAVEAAANTWTGRMAARYGYTTVGTPNSSMLSDTTLVIFSKGN